MCSDDELTTPSSNNTKTRLLRALWRLKHQNMHGPPPLVPWPTLFERRGLRGTRRSRFSALLSHIRNSGGAGFPPSHPAHVRLSHCSSSRGERLKRKRHASLSRTLYLIALLGILHGLLEVWRVVNSATWRRRAAHVCSLTQASPKNLITYW